MEISLINLIITLIINVAAIGFFAGGIKARLMELEKKQDKHNNLIERLTRVEESSKSAHNRLNGCQGRAKCN